MTPEERLKSLQECAESQKYIYQGDAGTLPQGPGLTARGWGPGGVQNVGFEGHLAPPTYNEQNPVGEESKVKATKNPLKRWLQERRASKGQQIIR